MCVVRVNVGEAWWLVRPRCTRPLLCHMGGTKRGDIYASGFGCQRFPPCVEPASCD